jgi:hypothetical protein
MTEIEKKEKEVEQIYKNIELIASGIYKKIERSKNDKNKRKKINTKK